MIFRSLIIAEKLALAAALAMGEEGIILRNTQTVI